MEVFRQPVKTFLKTQPTVSKVMSHIQAVCDSNLVFRDVVDSNLVFRDVVARWPVSHHDSFIMDMSSLSSRFENGDFENSWLLEDSGYSLKPWLMTPYARPASEVERKYNLLHQNTRRLIEQSFGVLKNRWRILDHTGGSLCYSPDKVFKITITCCVLHNICRRNGTPVTGQDSLIPSLDVGDDDAMGLKENASGIIKRRSIAEMLY